MPGIAYSFLFLAYLVIPWFLSLKAPLITAPCLGSFLLFNAVIVLLVFHRRNIILRRTVSLLENTQEQINLQDARSHQVHQNNFALSARSQRYKSLREILEALNFELNTHRVAEVLAEKVFSLIAAGRGVCTVHLLDPQTRRLDLCYELREHMHDTAKVREADIFDWWVLRQGNPLLIEDIATDFRFDRSRITDGRTCGFISLISAPLRSGEKTIGLVRIDNPQAHFFTQDDLRFLATVCDLAAVALENSQLFSRAQHLAIHDELTGLYTKSYFIDRLRDACAQSATRHETFGLLMADIDFFKKYNDMFGHTMGDAVLRNVGAIMRTAFIPYNPVIGRFGGEEFCMIIPSADKKKTLQAARALRAAVEDSRITLRRQQTMVTVSVGVASFPVYGLDAQTLLESADKALYRAKTTGRNKVCCL